MFKLTDTQQAFFMLLIFILPPLSVWMGLGFPMDKAALGILGSSIVSGILVFIKEMAGWKPPDGE